MNIVKIVFNKSLTEGPLRLYGFAQMSTFVHQPIPIQGFPDDCIPS